MKIPIIVVCTALVLSGIIFIPHAFAENVPEWVKNTAGWWAEDVISETEFVNAIEFLVKENIIQVNVSQASETSQNVPEWVKNTAGWWAEDVISETEFVNAIAYLIKHGIIIVNNNLSCVNDLSEIFDDPIATVQDICILHESSKHSELIPFIDKSNLNSLGFRGDEFSSVKPLDTYRIFMVGGSTMFGSGASSDETTISGILQKIFDSDISITQKIEVINVGMQGANSNVELDLIGEKLVTFSPDLVIVYDGLNDLRSDLAVSQIRENWKKMCEIGKENSFDVIISLQPIAGFGNKKLTQQEVVNSLTGEDHYGFQLIAAKSTYDYTGRALLSLQDDCNVADLRGIFDDINGPIYWDQGHISDTGNLIIAEKVYEITSEIIFKKNSIEEKFDKIISKYNSPIITSYLLSKIDINVDYTQLKKQDLTTKYKKDGNFFYLKNELGGSEKILVGKDLSKTDLSKINLTGQDLSGANLSGTADNPKDLRKIDFTGTMLRGANLSFTDLSGQDLSGKDLRGINFQNANLENADLTNVTISKSIQYLDRHVTCSSVPASLLEELEFDMCKTSEFVSLCSHANNLFLDTVFLERCLLPIMKNESIRTDFSNANLRNIMISFPEPSISFVNFVDFSGADLTGINFSDITFRACKFNEANFNGNDMSNTYFSHCDFTDAKFIDSKFVDMWFQNVSFQNAEIIGGSFIGPAFIDFVDFSNADLNGTSFDNILIVDSAATVGSTIFNCKNNQICN